MTPDRFAPLLEELIEVRQATSRFGPEAFRGVPDAEVDALAARLGLHIPAVVRHFLVRTGACAGHVQYGSTYLFPAWEMINRETRAAFAEEGFPQPDDTLVVFSHQGYDFLLLRTATDDPDPPVYRWVEGEAQLTRRFDAFSEYVEWLFSGGVL